MLPLEVFGQSSVTYPITRCACGDQSALEIDLLNLADADQWPKEGGSTPHPSPCQQGKAENAVPPTSPRFQ